MDTELALLSVPRYSYAETDYLAGVTPGTARRWLSGYQYWNPNRELVKRPPITVSDQRKSTDHGASFLDLIEVKAIGALKDAGFSLNQIRAIVENCQRLLGTPRPLVTLKFQTDGRDIFVQLGASLIEVGKRKGQHAWRDFLAPFLQDLEYDQDLARRWYPLGKDKSIVVDPDYGYGLPVVRHSGVRTEAILERFQVGEGMEEIARDFNVETTEVEQALQFEMRLVKRAA